MIKFSVTRMAKSLEDEAALREKALTELREAMKDAETERTEEEFSQDLMFHSFELDGRDYIMFPKNGGMVIDVAEFEETDEVMSEGPFKGFKIMIPSADGRDERDEFVLDQSMLSDLEDDDEDVEGEED